jgi:predicted Zn-ribbon and HTH transcriptional regulator
MTEPKPPPARTATPRERIVADLRTGAATLHQLSNLAGVREKDVAEHLEHLARSLPARGEKLAVEPAECMACGFVFRDRARLAVPGHCPECRSERIAPQRFRVESVPGGGGAAAAKKKQQQQPARPRRGAHDAEDDATDDSGEDG